ncbi:hypothetical protein J1N35_007793 [Gossypium stocksii]|uniref:Uncharacterized protein n=1 Tax=Gossypium stocksii TaxID=47602 RepID=A0A9D3W9V0_9ROSI|nr:hypothetical protein J1N35_007793 [Gossypium stocksii]
MMDSGEPLMAKIGPSFHDPFARDGPNVIYEQLQVPIELIIRARAKRFKEVLNSLIRGLWNNGQASHDQSEPNLIPKMIQMIQVMEEHLNGPGLINQSSLNFL